VNILKNLIKNQ